MQVKTFYKIFFLSCFFTLLSFLYYKINYSELSNAWDLIKIGYPQAQTLFLTNNFFKKAPFTFVILAWAVIGVSIYLFYYSVSLIYNNIRNWSVVERYYTKPTDIENFHFKTFAKRVFVHILVIGFYLLLLLLTVLVAFPLTKKIYTLNMLSSEIFSSIPVFFFWLIIFICFTFSLVLINKLMLKEQIEEEHGLDEVENVS